MMTTLADAFYPTPQQIEISNLRGEMLVCQIELNAVIYAGPETTMPKYLGKERHDIENRMAKARMKLMLLGAGV